MRKLILLLSTLLVAGEARAQFSLSNQWTYDLDALSHHDWQALGRALPAQSFRGAVALVFPDETSPITDPREVERWIVSGKPLRGVAFPGLTGDAAAAWSLAKQVSVANHRDDGQAAPVLAVHSGWTDLGAGSGHALEMTTLRAAVNAGRAYKADPITGFVARLLGERFEHDSTPVALVGHSAGGFYSANVAWLLGDGAKDKVRVYNLGLAARLPPGTRAFQVLGKDDALAYANSSSEALTAPSTRIEDGLSHLGGGLWRFGDSVNKRRWEIEPLSKIFARAGAGPAPSRAQKLASLADALGERARSTRALADSTPRDWGGRGLVGLKLGYDARALELAHERVLAMGEWEHARRAGDKKSVSTAIARTRELRAARVEARQALDKAGRLHLRNEGIDSASFANMLTTEAFHSLMPHNLFTKSVAVFAAAANFGTQWSRMQSGYVLGAIGHKPATHPSLAPAAARR